MSYRRKEGYGRKWRKRNCGKVGVDGEAWLLDNPHKFPYVEGRRCAMHSDT
jgi:hypothetical protein